MEALHKRMFDRTWTWAGQLRTTEKTIGVAPEEIAVRTRDLLDDGRYWLEHETFPPRESALRLHHRLVFVHLFPNGNGRHARLWADWILVRAGDALIDWGGNLGDAGGIRSAYVASLRAAGVALEDHETPRSVARNLGFLTDSFSRVRSTPAN